MKNDFLVSRSVAYFGNEDKKMDIFGQKYDFGKKRVAQPESISHRTGESRPKFGGSGKLAPSAFRGDATDKIVILPPNNSKTSLPGF